MILTREVANADNNAEDGDAKEVYADNDDDYEEGDADGSVKRLGDRTPLKAHWLVPLVLSEISEKPTNMSNADINYVIANYVKTSFITNAILQNARTIARDDFFGEPAHKVFFANALFAKMKECCHNVAVAMKDWKEVMRMLERVILSDLMRKK